MKWEPITQEEIDRLASDRNNWQAFIREVVDIGPLAFMPTSTNDERCVRHAATTLGYKAKLTKLSDGRFVVTVAKR